MGSIRSDVDDQTEEVIVGIVLLYTRYENEKRPPFPILYLTHAHVKREWQCMFMILYVSTSSSACIFVCVFVGGAAATEVRCC